MAKRITADEVKRRIHYDPDTGIFTHLTKARTNGQNQAGTRGPKGYVYLHLDRKKYLAHRLAWLYVYGFYPDKDKQVDHINGVRWDNKITNLRIVSKRENQQNREEHRNGRLPGALPSGSRWRARLRQGDKRLELGTYATQEEAHYVYLVWANNLGTTQ